MRINAPLSAAVINCSRAIDEVVRGEQMAQEGNEVDDEKLEHLLSTARELSYQLRVTLYPHTKIEKTGRLEFIAPSEYTREQLLQLLSAADRKEV